MWGEPLRPLFGNRWFSSRLVSKTFWNDPRFLHTTSSTYIYIIYSHFCPRFLDPDLFQYLSMPGSSVCLPFSSPINWTWRYIPCASAALVGCSWAARPTASRRRRIGSAWAGNITGSAASICPGRLGGKMWKVGWWDDGMMGWCGTMARKWEMNRGHGHVRSKGANQVAWVE